MKKIISVIIPVYNASAYLPQCIDSIMQQSLDNIEIILVNDGSTDGSGDICDMYAARDERIVVIHKKNEGPVLARNEGLMRSTCEYIAYVDADDWLETNMLERLYQTMLEQDVDIVMCGRYEDTGDTHRIVYHGIHEGRYNKGELLKKVYPNMIVNGDFFEWGLFPGMWDKLWKRNSLTEYQMAVDSRITMGDDAACSYPAILNANSIYVLHECLYHYRQTATSMVKQNSDIELQRKRFNILYNSVNNSLEKYKNIYDLREQWLEYVLFLMVPRADVLYHGIEELDYLFPFPEVKKGSNIILYGMGTYGQLLYKHIKKTRFCNILACADRNYIELVKQGVSAISLEEIGSYDYDAIVVANSFAKVRNEIYKDLCMKYPNEKIHLINENIIKSSESLKAFGLV